MSFHVKFLKVNGCPCSSKKNTTQTHMETGKCMKMLLVSNKKCPLPAEPFSTFQGLPFSGSGGTCYPSLLRSSHLLTRDH